MLENFKKSLQERIERNAVKSELTWTDQKGEHTETVLLKKSSIPIFGDWGRIYPPINEDGNINWLNLLFGGKRNFINLIIILAIIGMVLWQFKEMFSYIEYLKDIPCVKNCLEAIKQTPSLIPFR